MSAIERVESALSAHGSRKSGGNWNCPGPVHANGDRNPSLHLTSDSRGAALTCHAGCASEDIMKALGLAWGDLFDEPMREEARYPYYSDGRRFDHVRFASPKTFRWDPPLNGHHMPLYRLEEALVLPGPVYVIESEKDVNTLLGMGIAATCGPHGARSWSPEYAEALRDREVIIVADRDEAGVAHAVKVQAGTGGRIMQSAMLDDHADVGDHLAAGYGLDELVPLRQEEDERSFLTVNLAGLLKRGVPKPVLLCDNMLYEGGLHSIAGPPDCGKTTLALWWMLKLLQEGRKVLFLDEEGGEEIVTERLEALGATPDHLQGLVYAPFPGRAWDSRDVDALLKLVEEAEPAMVLMDSSAAFLARAGLDENTAADVTGWWSRVLAPVAREKRAAVLVIDHVVKDAEKQSRYARGSGAKLAALDCQIMVELVRPFSRGQDGLLKIQVSKDRRGYLHRYWKVRMRTSGGNGISPLFTRDDLEEAQEGQVPGPPARKKIYEVLTDVPAGYRQIVDAINARYGHFLSRQTVSTELNELARAGYAESIEQGREMLWIKCR